MLVVNGYYDGNVCVPDEKINKKPQKVSITFLDEPLEKSEKSTVDAEKNYDDAINESFGMWKNHDHSMSVDEYVRNMRKGRKFDIPRTVNITSVFQICS